MLKTASSMPLLFMLLLFIVYPSTSAAQTMINFEGLGNVQPVGTIGNTTFSSNWLSLSSCDAGGSGNFVNPPSGAGIAFILVGGAGTVGTITFAQPVTSVSTRYVDRTSSLTLTAFDASGNTVGVAVAPQTPFALTGQCGASDNWGTIGISNPSAPIASVTIHDSGNFFAIDDFTFTSDCSVDVIRESQGNPLWNPPLYLTPYDHSSSLTISQKGCALTSLSMALNTAGSTNDPGLLNQFMRTHDTDYQGLSVYWGPATRDFSQSTLKFHATRIDSTTDLQAASQYLDKVVCEQHHPVIVGVELDADRTPQHYVVVKGKKAGDYQIADPGFAKTALSQYNNEFVVRGFVADPPGDISELDLSVGDAAEMLLTGPSGQETGFDPGSGRIVERIASSVYFRDSIRDDVSDAPPSEVSHLIEISQPAQGNYQVVVTGVKLGTYFLSSRMFSRDGSPQPDILIPGIAGPGSTSSYAMQVNSTPGAASSVSIAATFSSTVDDITNSLHLGLIDNQGISTSLSQKIQAAQAVTGPARANILQAFINEVNAQAGKHIRDIAVQVLLGDANSLLSE
ncbi:MAG TPA: C39 family peptidase [Candidatus Angelobacter sp.]